MSTRSLPPTGGGAPALTASGISRPKNTSNPTEIAPLVLTLTMSPDAERAGRAVLALIQEACSGPTDEATVDDVATLELFFPSITRRVPEFHAFMDELVTSDRTDDVQRITGVPRRRGRPRRFPSLIALIEQVLDENPGFSVTKAVAWIDENMRGKVPGLLSVGRMQNLHSDFAELFALWSQSLYVPGDLLTAWSWKSPEEDQQIRDKLRKFIGTRTPGAIILHDPVDEVGVAEPNTFESLRSSSRSCGPDCMVLVDSADPEFGPYSRHRVVRNATAQERCSEGWRRLTPTEIEKL